MISVDYVIFSNLQSVHVPCRFFFFLNRSILAALHFNYNVNRETKRDKDGQPLLHVSYPKFKDGEATVGEARVSESFSLRLTHEGVKFDEIKIKRLHNLSIQYRLHKYNS